MTAPSAKVLACGYAEDAPSSILLLDEGKAKARPGASDRINRWEQVLVMALILTGEVRRRKRNGSASHRYAQLLAKIGDRPLGIRASHLLSLAKWLKEHHDAPEVWIETQGFRSQVVAPAERCTGPCGVFGGQGREG